MGSFATKLHRREFQDIDNLKRILLHSWVL